MARPPKPTQLKLLQGNPGKRPINWDEPKPEGELPLDPPDYMTDGAKALWVAALTSAPKGLLTSLDASELERWAVNFDLFRQATKKIQEEGATFVDENGVERISPWVRIQKSASAEMASAGGQLGFSPSARTRVHVKADKPSIGALERLAQGR